MKKFLATLTILLLFTAQVEAISYEDSTFAVDAINQKLRAWRCTPLKIWYAGDDFNSAKNIEWLNQLAEGQGYEQKISACMVFMSDFRTSPDERHEFAFNPDCDYKNWGWYFGFYEEDGTWKLLTWGY